MEPLAAFLDHLAHERRLSQYTLRNYRHAVDNFFLWLRKDAGEEAELSRPLVLDELRNKEHERARNIRGQQTRAHRSSGLTHQMRVTAPAGLATFALDVQRSVELVTLEHGIHDLEPYGPQELRDREQQDSRAAHVPSISVSAHGRKDRVT